MCFWLRDAMVLAISMTLLKMLCCKGPVGSLHHVNSLHICSVFALDTSNRPTCQRKADRARFPDLCSQTELDSSKRSRGSVLAI